MAKRWTLEELIEELKYKVAFNEGQTDQDFIGPSDDEDKHFRDAINEAYADEMEEAAQQGDPRWFYTIDSLTWPANQQNLEVPEKLRGKTWVSVYDITTTEPGTPMWFSDWEDGAVHRWRDSKTLQWGSAGPSSDKTIRITFQAEAEEMVDDGDEPELLPARFRHLLAWSAAIKLRRIADEVVPGGWVSERNDIRERMLKFFTLRGPIQTAGPGIRNTEPDYFGFYP